MKVTIYSVAMYLRLSRDDSDIGNTADINGNVKSESNSISSQREMVRSYIKEQENMELYDVYVDDGFSGSNFDRPDFKRMMEDVEAGKVNCVIVKDLSRFGRDYIDGGRYIQKTFPALGVRFIAITDHYDSLTADNSESQIILPVKNFINDSYCRDISMKVKSHQHVKRMNGEFIGAFAVYGYMKDPVDKNRLIIDDYAADIVRKIYLWKIDGESAFSISEKLNQLGILSPMDYKKFLGTKYKTSFNGAGKAKWSPVAVKRILTNEVYIGHLIQGKKEKVNYKVKRLVEKPEKEWIRVENTHEPIISEDKFNIVQNLLKTDCRKAATTDSASIFTGLIFCGDCKELMVRRVTRHKGEATVYYICSSYNRGEGCTRHSIREDKLIDIVFATIKTYANAYWQQSKLLAELAQKETNFEVIKKYDREIQRLRKEQDKYYALCSGLYEDLKNGIINRAEFEKLHKTYTENSEELEEALKSQEKLIQQMFKDGIVSGTRLDRFKRIKEIEELDRFTVTNMVQRIDIYEGKRIEIRLNFVDQYEIMVSLNQNIQMNNEKRGA